MRELAQRLLRRALQAVGADRVVHRGVLLPAPRLRLCGGQLRDDEAFLASAELEAQRLVERLGLIESGSVLDIGCGYGRLAIGLESRKTPFRRFLGLDVSREAIAWCRKHLESADERLSFRHVDVYNERYAPGASRPSADFRLPVEAESVDVVYLFSVFSHMRADDVRRYLGESRRLLKPGGRLFCTAFVEEGVPDTTVNPQGYRRAWSGPLHAVRYSRDFLESAILEAGLRLVELDHAVEIDGQSGLYLTRAA